MKRYIVFIIVLNLVLVNCKTKSDKITLGPNNKDAIIEKINVIDLELQFISSDSVKQNQFASGIVSQMFNDVNRQLIVHNNSKIAKITFDSLNKIKTHLLFDKESMIVKYASLDGSYEETNMDTAFDKSQIPMIEQKIKEDGIMKLDSINQYIINGYECMKLSLMLNENESGEYFLPKEFPRIKGTLGIIFAGFFDLSIESNFTNDSAGVKVIVKSKNKRNDLQYTKYLELDSTTYSSSKE